MFQSTRPRGARPGRPAPHVPAYLVSIHAPAWGATFVPSSRRSEQWCFNPRARVGRDHPTIGDLFNSRQFQSTRPRGARLEAGHDISEFKVFQSTRPRGARQPHHNSLRDKDFFRVTREPMLSLDPKGTGQVAATQKPMKSISC